MRLVTMVIVAMGLPLAGGCQSNPCEGGAPGIRVVIHFSDVFAEDPVQMGIQYRNGTGEDWTDRVPPTPWPDPLTIVVPYGPTAVNGLAMIGFYARPDDSHPSATGTVDVDLDRCVTADLAIMSNAQDAGVPGCPPCAGDSICVERYDGTCGTSGPLCVATTLSCPTDTCSAECEQALCTAPYQCQTRDACGGEAPGAFTCYGP